MATHLRRRRSPDGPDDDNLAGDPRPITPLVLSLGAVPDDDASHTIELSYAYSGSGQSIPRTFPTIQVNVVFVDDGNGGQVLVRDNTANNIYLPGHTFNTGDQITLTTVSGVNLPANGTFYVIKIDNDFIRLAGSYCDAVGSAGGFNDPCALPDGPDSGNAPDPRPVTPVALFLGAAPDETAVHQIRLASNALVDGGAYYVVWRAPDGSSFAISETPGGPVIALDATGRRGTHHFGVVEVDLLDVTGAGLQALYVDITGDANGTGRLLDASGMPLSGISPPPGDGKSGASASGGNGGGLAFAFPSATLSGTPQVDAAIHAAVVNAGTSVTMEAISAFSVTARADSAGGGVLDAAKASASADFGRSPTTATVTGGTTIIAVDDIIITGRTDHEVLVNARSVGGGAISGKVAFTHAWLHNDLVVAIGAGAVLEAGRNIDVSVDSKTTVKTTTETEVWGVGVGADSDDTNGDRGVKVGTSTSDPAKRSVTVGAGATITGRTVSLEAVVNRLDANAKSSAKAINPVFFGVASAFARSKVDVWSDATVQIAGGTTRTIITGSEGVDLIARHNTTGVPITRDSQRLAVALIFPQQSVAEGADFVTSTVDTDPGVTIVAGARPTTGSPLTASAAGLNVALYVDTRNFPTTPQHHQLRGPHRHLQRRDLRPHLQRFQRLCRRERGGTRTW